MELKKRLSALFLALVMLLSVSVSALAYNSTIDLEGLSSKEISDFLFEVTPYSLPTDIESRYYVQNGAITYGLSDKYTTNTVISKEVTPYSATLANVYTVLDGTSNAFIYDYGYTIVVPSGCTYDVTANVGYSASEYESITIGGSVASYLFCAKNGSDSTRARVFPDKVQLLINGEPYGDIYSHGSAGASINENYELTEDINTLGFRFTFTQGISGSTASGYNSSTVILGLYFDDVSSWDFASAPEEDPNTGLLQGILQWIIGIYNSVFVPDSQKDDADNFQSEVSDTVAGADEVKDELDQLEKPDPEDIDTDLSDIITDDAYTQQTQIFADLLRFDKITDMLMIVFTMALISYVLFGKKG